MTAYHGVVPLFSRYNLEGQIESIYKRSVPRPGGGSIVIDHTEALTAIDVNSGKNTRGSTQGETAFTTNQAAVKEVARPAFSARPKPQERPPARRKVPPAAEIYAVRRPVR